MDIEYHYYITYIIALRAGFSKEEAYKIAYSSQYTDDNNEQYEINSSETDTYSNYISQTMDITKPKEMLLRIYPIFHFLPGTKDEIVNNSLPRRDGKLHLLNTIPGNMNAQRLIQSALESQNPYRIGITTHMYADTYSHQNFVGIKDEFNAMKGFLKKLIPNIGHADAKYKPDLPAFIWNDERFVSNHVEVNNRERFLAASEHIFELYSQFGTNKSETAIGEGKRVLRADIEWSIGDYDKKNSKKGRRCERYESLIGDDFIEYDKDVWFDAAVYWKSDPMTIGTSDIKRIYSWKENYKESNWYNFQEAVKMHQKEAEVVLGPTFDKMEIAKLDIW